MKALGLIVSEGTIVKNQLFKVTRNEEVIVEGLKAESLKILKENAREVKKGMECGLVLEGFSDFKIDDIISSYDLKELPKTFKQERVEIQEYEVRDK